MRVHVSRVYRLVGCNREKRKVGCQPYTQICSAAKMLQSNQIAVFQPPRACTVRKLHHNHITYTSIHNYYITNPGIGLAPDVPFFAKVGLHPTIYRPRA